MNFSNIKSNYQQRSQKNYPSKKHSQPLNYQNRSPIKIPFKHNPKQLQRQFLQSQNQLKISSFKQSLQQLPNLQQIYFQDNSKYIGQVVDDNIRQGIGIFQTQNGQIYLGDWQNDTYHGYGMYIYQDGQRYQGQLIQGMKQGNGQYYYIDGRIYNGQWKNDQRQGNGVQRDTQKYVEYHGQWKNDRKQGQGKLIYIDNSIQAYNQPSTVLSEGLWSNNVLQQGFINTQIYQGQYKNKTLCGQGVYKFPDGSVYRGQFYNNLFDGKGVYYYSNGDVYEGNFFCGLKTGYGVYKYFTGDIYQGHYSKDLKSGQGKFLFVNGNYYIGQFQRDSFYGKGKYFFNKDEWISGWWENGQLLKGDNKIEDIGKMRNKNMYLNKLEEEKQIKTDRPNINSYSPLHYSPSINQFSGNRIRSPIYNKINHTQRNLKNLQSSQINGVPKINLSHSALSRSKFMQAHTPQRQEQLSQNQFYQQQRSLSKRNMHQNRHSPINNGQRGNNQERKYQQKIMDNEEHSRYFKSARNKYQQNKNDDNSQNVFKSIRIYNDNQNQTINRNINQNANRNVQIQNNSINGFNIFNRKQQTNYDPSSFQQQNINTFSSPHLISQANNGVQSQLKLNYYQHQFDNKQKDNSKMSGTKKNKKKLEYK